MNDIGSARLLAETMVAIGTRHDVRTTAFLTAMDAPLGRSAGNALEVAESLAVLDGGGPDDVVDLTLMLAREMLALAGIDADPTVALRDGSARATWDAMVRSQGGDPDVALPVAPLQRTIAAPAPGFLVRLDARAIGEVAWRLGAGRARKDDTLSPTAGVTWTVTVGDAVDAGDPVLVLHADDRERLDAVDAAARAAFSIGPDHVERGPIVLDRITA
jgi:thymidine phosphorylase